MATILEKTVDTGATGDYTSLAAWATAFGGVANSGDLVGQDQIAKAVCICTDGEADGAWRPRLYGWTSGSKTCYPWVYVPDAYMHRGVWPAAGANVYRLAHAVRDPDLGEVLQWIGVPCKIRGIAAQHNTANGGALVLFSYMTGSDLDNLMFELDDCYADLTGCPEAAWGIEFAFTATAWTSGAADFRIRNSVFDMPTADAGSPPAISRAVYEHAGNVGSTAFPRICLAHAALIGAPTAIESADDWPVYVKNCIFWNNATADVDTGGTLTADGNASARATGTNRVDLTDLAGTKVFMDPDNRDWRALRGDASPCRASGQDIRVDAVIPVTTDLLGVARPAVPCIGPLEIALAGVRPKNTLPRIIHGSTTLRR